MEKHCHITWELGRLRPNQELYKILETKLEADEFKIITTKECPHCDKPATSSACCNKCHSKDEVAHSVKR